MNDLDRIVTALEQEHPATIALLREVLPRFLSLIRNVRRARITTALDAAHAHLAQFRREADATVRRRTVNDSGEASERLK